MAAEESSSEESERTSSSSSSSTSSEEAAVPRGPPPTPPKPPRRAVNFYIKDNYLRGKQELGPYRRPSDIFRHLSAKWTKLRARDRDEYETKASNDLARYKQERLDYERRYAAWSGRTDRPPIRQRKRKADAPRRPKSALKFYAEKNWANIKRRFAKGPRRHKQVWETIRRRWMKLSELERAPYEKKHWEDVKRYRKEMAAVTRLRKLQREAYLRKLGYLPAEEETDEESETEEENTAPAEEQPRNGHRRFCQMQ